MSLLVYYVICVICISKKLKYLKNEARESATASVAQLVEHWSNSRGRRFDSQPEGLGVAFFATGPGLGLIMYIFTTLEFLHITLTFIY